MKKTTLLLSVVSALLMTSSLALAAPEVKIGGTADVHYLNITETDADAKNGTWELEGVDLKITINADDKISAHLKFDLDKAAGFAEEAWVAVKLSDAVKIQVGKDEMPFIQDKNGTIHDAYSYIHGYEIDKVLGLVYSHKFSDVVSMNLSTYENEDNAVGDEESDTGLFQSYALRVCIKAKDTMKFGVAAANQHDELAAATDSTDRSMVVVNTDLKFDKVGLYLEYLTFTDVFDNAVASTDDVTGNVLQFGVSVSLPKDQSICLEYNAEDTDTDADDNEANTVGLTYRRKYNDNVSSYAGVVSETTKNGTGADDTKGTIWGGGVKVGF